MKKLLLFLCTIFVIVLPSCSTDDKATTDEVIEPTYSRTFKYKSLNYGVIDDESVAVIFDDTYASILKKLALPSCITMDDGHMYDVVHIGTRCFYGCKNMCSIDIPASVQSIGEYAFGECSRLITILIHNEDIDCSANAFYGCAHDPYNGQGHHGSHSHEGSCNH